MNKLFYLISVLSFLSSCGENIPEESTVDTTKNEKQTGSLESRAARHIESQLGINSAENYSYEIYKEYLDGDEKIDAIITVNRLEFAMDEAAKSGNTAKRAELGFMGNYNYIFYYDGGLDQISPPIAIPSSPQAKLKIAFENISSEAYKDILVDFRIRNSSYKDFFTVFEHTPRRVFQWKNYDGLNAPTSEAYYFKFDAGTAALAKDILVMKALLVQPNKEVDIYSYEPNIKKTEELSYRFFYYPEQGKYVTQKQ